MVLLHIDLCHNIFLVSDIDAGRFSISKNYNFHNQKLSYMFFYFYLFPLYLTLSSNAFVNNTLKFPYQKIQVGKYKRLGIILLHFTISHQNYVDPESTYSCGFVERYPGITTSHYHNCLRHHHYHVPNNVHLNCHHTYYLFTIHKHHHTKPTPIRTHT